jgi:hypothetical protein
MVTEGFRKILKEIFFLRLRDIDKETKGMAEDYLRRLLDWLLDEAKHLGPRYVVDGKMAIPNNVFEVDGPGDRSTRYPN